jgi:ribose transport system permease protein
MAILAIVAFGITIVMVGGAFDLSVGSQAALHGVISALVMVRTDSVWLGVAAGLASGLLVGLLNGLTVGLLGINPFIATLGTLVLARGVALALTGGQVVTGLPDEIREFGTGRPLGLPWIVWLMVVCALIAAYVLHATPFGLRVFALGNSREAARLAGIRVARTQIATFVCSGLFAAVAGIAITSRVRSGQPLSGELLELYAIAAAVLGGTSLYGGRGAVWRTVFGVALIAVIQNGLNLLHVATEYQMIAIGVVFIIAALAETVRTSTSTRRALRVPPRDPGDDRGSPADRAGARTVPLSKA